MKRIKEFLQTRLEAAKKNQKGFSLVELIIVIAILGIIAAIALPNITGAIDNARKNTDVTNAKAIANAAVQAQAKDDQVSSLLPGFATDGTPNTALFIVLEEKSSPTTNAEKFANAVLKEIDTIPAPKYKGTTATEDQFVMEVDAYGKVTVYVAAEAATALTNAVQVYPQLTTDNPYATK